MHCAGCEFPNKIGDGFCDDRNNNPKCEYDGGDCCGSNVNKIEEYCTICECRDPNHSGNGEGNIDQITGLVICIRF